MHDLTQEELAEKIEASRQTIIAIENNRHLPFLRLVFKIARLFEVKIEDIGRKLYYSAVIAVGVFLFSFFIAGNWIGYEVKATCREAKGKYDGDCVEALMSFLEDENQSFRARNNAIWALGQLGNNRTLPVLQSYYSGSIPAREPLDEVISQYELRKAIKLTSGGINISAFVWRSFFNDK